MEGTIGIWMSAWMLMHSGISATTTFQSRLQMLMKRHASRNLRLAVEPACTSTWLGLAMATPWLGCQWMCTPVTWAGGSCLQCSGPKSITSTA
eukprot:6232926-Lingulodinium_polyedra.AAC.1